MTHALRISMVGFMTIAMLVGAGCASDDGGSSSSSGSETKAQTPVPASSPLAKIESGMTEIEVRKLLGEPDTSKSYMTGKAWIPFYFGGDTHRVEWIYSGVGRVIFTRNRWSGSITVVDRVYEP